MAVRHAVAALPGGDPVIRADPAAKEELEAIRALNRLLSDPEVLRTSLRLSVVGRPDFKDLPDSVYRAVRLLLYHLARGSAVTIAAHGTYLTTSQAADLLQVSRPHVAKLCDEDKIHCEWVGAHRRLLLEDVLRYRGDRARGFAEGMARLIDLGRAGGDYKMTVADTGWGQDT